MSSKIRYRVKPNTSINLNSANPVKDYLEALGIENAFSFIERPRLEDQEFYGNLDNIEEAAELLYKGFKENKIFFLQVDSDVDGITSSAIFYSFFKRLFPEAKIRYRLHEGKEHGVIVDTVPLDTDYVIIPDAGTMQYKQQQEMVELGYQVIIMDHHNADEFIEMENVCVVNNQMSENFNNKSLSGAGVVYKVIQAFNFLYQDEFPIIYQDFVDLAALGIVADMMDTRNLDNNYIIYKGLSNIKNPMFKALLEKQAYSVTSTENPTKIDVAFYVAPLMNGVIRYGTENDKAELFKGFIDYHNEEIIETTYAGNLRREKYYEFVARNSYNVKEKQNREKLKFMKYLCDRIDADKSYENQLLIVKASKEDDVAIPKTITGLVAMELLKKYKKPTLLLRPKMIDNELYYAGSGRGKQNGDFTSLMHFLRESGLVEYAEGHGMAHGVMIREDNIDRLIEYANKKLKHIEFDVNSLEVDFMFTEMNINRNLITQFGSINHIYGNGIQQPKFAFELMIDKMAINFIGRGENTVKFRVNGVDFIKFNNKALATQLKEIEEPTIKATVIGRAQVNEWGGNITPQIMIDDIEVEGYEQELNKLF